MNGMTIDRFWRRVNDVHRQLAGWAAMSLATGALLAVGGTPFWRGVGVQFLVWGAIDGAIAAAGWRDRRRAARSGLDRDPIGSEHRRQRLHRLLLVNVGLDVVYLAIGAALLGFDAGPVRAGHGVGVIVQGGFLLLFDAWHAARLRRPVMSR
ncbi:MAG: hypothetical protein U5J97_03960 [Trueperaceae bacterium]|nr:hypothetical protein [Trueperaceae bacterium]